GISQPVPNFDPVNNGPKPKPKPPKPSPPKPATIAVKFISDAECTLQINEKDKGLLEVGKAKTFNLLPGNYFYRVTSTITGDVLPSKNFTVSTENSDNAVIEIVIQHILDSLAEARDSVAAERGEMKQSSIKWGSTLLVKPVTMVVMDEPVVVPQAVPSPVSNEQATTKVAIYAPHVQGRC
ncbi:MAG TPA: hypothetical protein VD794_15085, partial [Flavisolibacter sp.]|nr:hypothetical protein [Flavisolibacter sp.]